MAATLSGNNLGVLWSSGTTGNLTSQSTEGDDAINSGVYDCDFPFANEESWI